MNGCQEFKTLEDVQGVKVTISIKKKRCLKCLKEKNLNDFNFNKTKKDGLASWCRVCANKNGRKWASEHKESVSYWSKKWKKENPDRKRELNKNWAKKNPEKDRESKRKWEARNIEKKRERSRIYASEKRKTPKGNIDAKMSKNIRRALIGVKKNKKHWEHLVGYTANQLKKHIEKQFKDGMTWEKFINGEIHIDHIIPLSVFNFKTPKDEDFKRCWALKNLQPLWAVDNLKKSNKLYKHFQPSLF